MLFPSLLLSVTDVPPDPILPAKGWIAVGVIVLLALVGFSVRDFLSDVSRFSPRRIWAISGVCFAESIRKRVLWIAPLAIAGAIVVTQFEQALDEQDAIRQTTKICLFATGLVAMITSIILACTNLPKEIESRVIYTIVTKPTTRLEIVCGKIVGFARVSAAILLIMGLFTWGYLQVRALAQRGQIAARLSQGELTPTERNTLEHYQDVGLLTARSYVEPATMNVYAKVPAPGDAASTIFGRGAQDVIFPFDLDRATVFGESAEQGIGQTGVLVRIRADHRELSGTTTQATTQPVAAAGGAVAVSVLGADRTTLLTPDAFRDPAHLGDKNPAALALTLPDAGQAKKDVYAYLPPEACKRLFGQPRIYLRLFGSGAAAEYIIGPDAVTLLRPSGDAAGSAATVEIPRAKGPDGKILPPTARGRLASHGGQEVSGATATHPAAAAVYAFRGVKPPVADRGRYAFELVGEVERTGDADVTRDNPTSLAVEFRDLASNKVTPLTLQVESRQNAYFTLPADAITGPDYDVSLRCVTVGDNLNLQDNSLRAVSADEGFAFNLFKSLLILWMMTVLVVTVSVLCSTFLSWPIAVVLTVVLLLGRWGVMQLADTTGPGLGRVVVNDFFQSSKDAAGLKVVSSSVDFLATSLNTVAQGMPDITRFEAIDDLERGVSVPWSKLTEAATVLAAFALPALALGYFSLRQKEVAP